MAIDFYKIFADKLAPILLDMFEDSLKKGSLPQTLNEAKIILLLKPGKDPLKCNSYRPISLLNSDVKILAKILALRLDTAIENLISKDQTGFVRGRHSFSNIRRLLGVIHSSKLSQDSVPQVVISLDAEKAIDRVEWKYLFFVLEKYGFGTSLLSLIKLLNFSPKASVITNRVCSKYFPLSRGTRQGCPLSPLLFTLAIEPLSIALRHSQYFTGISCRGIEHRVSLYADDMLLYISDPILGIPQVVQILKQFGTFSG